VITPWNAPFYLDICKTAAALAAGCTVVLKPAPETSSIALILGEVVAQHTDIPPGVVNVVTTSDLEVASMLSTPFRVEGGTSDGDRYGNWRRHRTADHSRSARDRLSVGATTGLRTLA